MEVENFHRYYKPEPLYLALEDVPDAEFMWYEKEINQFEMLWNEGTPLKDIAGHFGKTEISILLIAVDRSLKGGIKAREGWRIW